jgi:segregation and condensation protein A
LLRLIERRELDVLAISLAAVTEQYLEYLSEARLRDPEHLTAFLVVAAKLLYIKSSLLLPARARSESRNDEPPPDNPAELARRLETYRMFRDAAADLARRFGAGRRMYPHPPVAYTAGPRKQPAPLDPALLQIAYHHALARAKEEETKVIETTPRMTVAEALGLLRGALERYASVAFSDLVRAEGNRSRLVAVFLAVLELVRQGHAMVSQDGHFAEIRVIRGQPADAAPG